MFALAFGTILLTAMQTFLRSSIAKESDAIATMSHMFGMFSFATIVSVIIVMSLMALIFLV